MKNFMRTLLSGLVCGLTLLGSAHADELLMARIHQDFPEAMLRLQAEITKLGYTVSRVQRVDIGLTASGYQTDKYRLVFYGKPAEISHISQQYPEMTPYLPLKIAIFAEADDTLLVAANPVILAPGAPAALQQQLASWEADLQKLLAAMKLQSD
ncbi:MAG: DUF302 domain-containing protein [Gammaproteobacteria bacterium]